jgi:hypothetical protein
MSDIHNCSYYCTRPECALQQRNELRDEMLATLEWKKSQQQAEPVQAEPVAVAYRQAIEGDNGQSMTQADSGNPSY